MECTVHQTKIQSICWDWTWVVATITLEVLMWVQRGFCSPTPLRELTVPWLGIYIPICKIFWWKLPKCNGKQWKLQKKGTTTVLGVVLSVNWLKQCGFFCRMVIIQEEIMWNNVQMVQMLINWEKHWESKVKGTYPETKTVLVRELTGELFLCCFKVNTWGFYRGEGGCC